MANAEIGDTPLTSPVEILLASFNGERFLREQIESILAQNHSALRITASDDGSSDSTRAILTEYAERLPQRFTLLAQAIPTGSAKGNFLRLMQHATADYLCFADQDDVWMPDKVSRSLAALHSLEQQHGDQMPLLVFSDLRVADEHLQTIAPSYWRMSSIDPTVVSRLPRLLGQSVVTGCTMLINRPMLEVARLMPAAATMHDRWIALLAATMGASTSLREPTVIYRQHERNVIGASVTDTSPAGLARRTADSSGRRAERIRCEQMAQALLECHVSKMSARQAEVLRAYLRSGRSQRWTERLALTLHYGFFRDGLLKNLALLLDLARSASDASPQR